MVLSNSGYLKTIVKTGRPAGMKSGFTIIVLTVDIHDGINRDTAVVAWTMHYDIITETLVLVIPVSCELLCFTEKSLRLLTTEFSF